MRIKEKNGDFVIVDFNELDAYKIACKIEEDGVHFYKKLIGGSVNQEVKDAISFMLKEVVTEAKNITKTI